MIQARAAPSARQRIDPATPFSMVREYSTLERRDRPEPWLREATRQIRRRRILLVASTMMNKLWRLDTITDEDPRS